MKFERSPYDIREIILNKSLCDWKNMNISKNVTKNINVSEKRGSSMTEKAKDMYWVISEFKR